MTPKDRQLIDLLRANARESVSALARKLGVARTTVQERLRRLEESGTISGYTVRMGQTRERPALTAHVLLEVNPKKADGVIREFKAIPAIRSSPSTRSPGGAAAENIAGMCDLDCP